ncbi:glycerophosphodiester phosphodiesterase [Helicobacter saguini]|uniref:glycerophosphodiester phosphodiesterase n=2 Tax=Helicobacter saguini TaxID=1548018 RepID=A0A347W736_9HELI|nr:glycerophosphodiester phosphodiesterase [Helicobacter saguini]MWV66925.1 glycerophosphodiester phosphodiesterase [Helicobacter saguini]MWV69273.1 glycerophosphodiester phosphodiesterase [Helicobacter saguini]MWV71171.1 glycerophosphodiester phosphodiesterase [Helicobacter saguini]TLD95072.1 glycerophosphodiester phosphodiesterase [Helicobacter saguini]
MRSKRDSISIAIQVAAFFILVLYLSGHLSFLKAAALDSNGKNKVTIAHRGASGYVPEHTLESKVLAYQMGADFLEQDVALSKDNRLIVVHDLYIENLTNVADIFPNRKRQDGHYYVIDFTLDELKSLKFSEPFEIKNGRKVPIYPQRFPIFTSTFSFHTLEEEIEFIQGLNKTLGRNVGIYVETKAPWFHKQNGKDISLETLKVLKKYGYDSKNSNVYFQSFDYPDLVRVRTELLPKLKMDLKLVALVGYNDWLETYEFKGGKWLPYDFSYLQDSKNFAEIAKVAQGVGPTLDMLYSIQNGRAVANDYCKSALKNGLNCHPYTLRADALPKGVKSVDEALELILYKAGADGIFSDFPDLAVKFIESKRKK